MFLPEEEKAFDLQSLLRGLIALTFTSSPSIALHL
jgi:hypothetical protein